MNDQLDVGFKPLPSQDITQHIVSILKGIHYGSIEIVVHDGHIVQIDKHEKFRLKPPVSTH